MEFFKNILKERKIRLERKRKTLRSVEDMSCWEVYWKAFKFYPRWWLFYVMIIMAFIFFDQGKIIVVIALLFILLFLPLLLVVQSRLYRDVRKETEKSE
jgi:hypothetical protein